MRLDALVDEMRHALRDAEPSIRVNGAGVRDEAARVRVFDPADSDRALNVLRAGLPGFPVGDVEFKRGENGEIEARPTPSASSKAAREAANRSIEIIRRRVNPTGAHSIAVVQEGERIILRTPTSFDRDVISRRVGRTGLLTFHRIDERASPELAAEGDNVPPGARYVPFAGSSGQQGGLVVERRPRLMGGNLTMASPGFDAMTNRPVLNFQFDASGARAFCRITTLEVGKQFAIVLDHHVLTAPVIQEPICGGRGQISGNFTPQETQELALLLRAGALPAPLRIVEQRTVGAR